MLSGKAPVLRETSHWYFRLDKHGDWLLGHTREAQQWREKAGTRAAIMRKLFWDAEREQFFDYDFEAGKRSDYEYASTFYPLWTGWATLATRGPIPP